MPEKVKSTLGAVFLCLAIAFCTIGPLVFYAPGVLRDMVAGDPMNFAPVKVKDARCKSYYFLVSLCSTELADGTSVGEMYVGGMGGERTVGLRSLSDPAHVTTSAGLEHRGNRAAAAILPLLLLLGFGAMLVRRARRDARQAAVGLQPLPGAASVEARAKAPPVSGYAPVVGGSQARATFGRRGA